MCSMGKSLRELRVGDSRDHRSGRREPGTALEPFGASGPLLCLDSTARHRFVVIPFSLQIA